MLQPKKMKYRKQFRGKRRGSATRGVDVAFGEFGLKAMDRGWFSARQIESARKTITHHTKRVGKMWIRVFPDKPTSKKGPGAKMGSGKGDNEQFVAVIRPGRILFELSGLKEVDAREAFRKASFKIPMKTEFVIKR
ncbi:MAG TPA: 50S ribosomal protein L16 [Candidatus Pacebacteria bacterium]|nr:MAG: 50S ribosomal protein L16 [Candidatus Pacebacteria bacterium RIFOXYB1_FULL_44_10]HAU99041.1 50S ribosomal protein L16 [Candidatus Paceibacterota bacterium]HAX01244.1 50S ribosomal protein L16 [Candidatus Paceibacterota bacterium]